MSGFAADLLRIRFMSIPNLPRDLTLPQTGPWKPTRNGISNDREVEGCMKHIDLN